MMTDIEQKAIRNSVRGMPLHRAKNLPIYDGIRGAIVGGRPAEEYYAIMDGAVPSILGAAAPTSDAINAKAQEIEAHKRYVDSLNGWRKEPVNDNKSPAPKPEKQFARDGRPMSTLTDEERAYERYVDSLNGWRR